MWTFPYCCGKLQAAATVNGKCQKETSAIGRTGLQMARQQPEAGTQISIAVTKAKVATTAAR